MAKAELGNPFPVKDGVAYRIDTYPDGEEPFRGPDHRDWDDFRLDPDGEGASFHWRTGADHVRRAAERFARREWTFARAARDPFVRAWLDGGRLRELADASGDEALAALDDGKLARRLLAEAGPRVADGEDGLLAYYGEDDDAYLEDAAEALELPPWARATTFTDGGMGASFTSAAIVIDAPHGLADLAAWLAERVRREPHLPPVDFVPWADLPTRGRLGLTHLPGQLTPGRPLDPDVRLAEDLRAFARVHRAARVLTLLERMELADAGRIDLAARRAGLRWSGFPIPDMGVPASMAATVRRVAGILRDLRAGRTTIVHCRGGLGRTGLVAACVLVAAGTPARAALEAVRRARPGAVEASAQACFVEDFEAEWRRRGAGADRPVARAARRVGRS